MSAVKLLPPTKRRLDLAVFHSVAVADDEVISDSHPTVPVSVLPFQMGGVDALHTATQGSGVVDYDPARRPGRDIGFPRVDGQRRQTSRFGCSFAGQTRVRFD